MRVPCVSRSLASSTALLLVLSLAAAATAASGAHSGRASHKHVAPQLPPASSVPLVSWIRNAAIQLIYGKSPSAAVAQLYGASTSPRYAKQTVIRFNVSSSEEEQALSEAADRLFLDIWSFNNYTGTADIRLDKEDVEPLLTLLPESLHYAFSTLIPDLSEAVQGTFPHFSTARSPARALLTQNIDLLDPSSEASRVAVLSTGTDNIFFQDYQPLPVIEQWMKLLDVMFPFVNMISVGQSAEGREILGLRVGASQDDGDFDEAELEDLAKYIGKDELDELRKSKKEKKETRDKRRTHPVSPPDTLPDPGPVQPELKKTILITGGLHAREWISTSTVNFVAWSLISGYGKTRMITKLLDNFDIVFVPVVNPDGYEYTWHTDRLWRKTRQGTNFRYCRGLDLDHAFGYEWDSNTRIEPCSETYGGEAAFQAIEARTLSTWARNETEQNNVEFVGYLDLHSYSQQIMFPFSYSCTTDPPNLENLEELAAGIAKAIRLTTGEMYSISSACEGVMGYRDYYRTSSDDEDNETDADATNSSQTDVPPPRTAAVRIESGGGSAIDYFFHELRAKYSYQIKLRDTGSYGFLLPSSEILPTGEEVFSAVKYFGDFLLGNNGIEKSIEEAAQPPKQHKQPKLSSEAGRNTEQWVELRRRR